MTIVEQAGQLSATSKQLQAHANEAIRLIDAIVERESKARQAQLAALDAMLATIDAFCKPKGESNGIV